MQRKILTLAIMMAFAGTTVFAQETNSQNKEQQADKVGEFLNKKAEAKVDIKGEPVVRSVAAPPNNFDPRHEAGFAPPASLKETRLPGLKADSPSLKPIVVHTRIGINELIDLSSSYLNRISTPFENPVIVDISGSQSKIIGSEIFYLPKGNDPISIYIFDKSNPSQTINLTIKPNNKLPAQNVLVKIENFRALGNLSLVNDPEKGGVPDEASDHESTLSSLVIGAIKGKINGFSPIPIEAGTAKIEDVEIAPDVVFQGYYLDIYRYQLNNVGERTIALNEGIFYRKGVKAVSFFPLDTLRPKEKTFVFIVAAKNMDPNPAYFFSEKDQEVLGANGMIAQ